MSDFTDRAGRTFLTIDDFRNRPPSYSLPRSLFRKLVHFFSFHFILNRRSASDHDRIRIEAHDPADRVPSKVFLTSKFFADFVQSLDLTGKSVVEVGTGSGILALSAARAGRRAAFLRSISPAAVDARN